MTKNIKKIKKKILKYIDECKATSWEYFTDESLVHNFIHEMKDQSKQWTERVESSPKKARKLLSNKVMG